MECCLFAIKSVVIIKNANVKVASHTTAAFIGIFPVSPYISDEIGQIYRSEFTKIVAIAKSQASIKEHLKINIPINTADKNTMA